MGQQRQLLEQLHKHGQKRLVHHGVGAWSFEEVYRDALRARERLAGWGVGPGMRVGILGDTSYDWVVTDLALQSLDVSVGGIPKELSAGDLGALSERLDFSLLLLADTAAAGNLPFASPLGLASGHRPRLREPRGRRLPAEGTLAFSSGSTGVPKCIVLPEAAFDGLVAFIQLLRPRDDDALLMFLPFGHYDSRSLVEAAIHQGMDVCLASAATAFDACSAFRPTICHAPPVFYDGLARRIRGSASEPRAAAREILGGKTRLLFTGMSPIAQSTLTFLFSAGVEVFQGYGSMEAGNIACCLPGQNRLGSVGKPVRPGGFRFAPDGEIVVTRETVPPILGFVDDAGHFVRANPKEIHTGDLGRLDDDGYLWIVGRKKNLIITATGHKVQPELVEEMIEQNPRVRKAIVLGEGLTNLTAILSVESDDPAVRAAIEADVEQINRHAGDARPRIDRVVFTTTEFTVDNGLLTPELSKPNRPAIQERFLGAAPGPSGAPAAGAAADASDAPVDPAELQAMLDIWRRVLGVDVAPDANFFDAGGSSLLLMQISKEIEQRWGRSLAAREILGASTPRAVLRAVGAHGDGPPQRTGGLTMAELIDDVRADVQSVLDTSPGDPGAGPRHTILLTGATGFLGAHVLAELSANTPHRILCLLRDARGGARLTEVMRSYDLGYAAERVEVVEGDLGRPLLGLDEERARALSTELRAVLHCGAAVNFLHPYARLRDANVGGTREAARIARLAGAPLHYVSTLSVFETDKAGDRILDEGADLAYAGVLAAGYPQSKWAAEYLVRRCAEAGVDCTVYRPGEILANVVTSRWNKTDFVAQVLAAIAELGVAPDLETRLIAAPVDFVARAIAVLTGLPREQTRGRTYHLASPAPFDAKEFYGALASCGRPVEVVPLARWVELLAREQGAGRASFDAILPVFTGGEAGRVGGWAAHLRAEWTCGLLDKLGCRLDADPRVYLQASARAALALGRAREA